MKQSIALLLAAFVGFEVLVTCFVLQGAVSRRKAASAAVQVDLLGRLGALEAEVAAMKEAAGGPD